VINAELEVALSNVEDVIRRRAPEWGLTSKDDIDAAIVRAQDGVRGRMAALGGLAEDEVRVIMGAQWPRWRRLQMADDVLWNGGEKADLERQCRRIHESYCRMAEASATIPANPG